MFQTNFPASRNREEDDGPLHRSHAKVEPGVGVRYFHQNNWPLGFFAGMMWTKIHIGGIRGYREHRKGHKMVHRPFLVPVHIMIEYYLSSVQTKKSLSVRIL